MKKIPVFLFIMLFLLVGCNQSIQTKKIVSNKQKGIELEYVVRHKKEKVTDFKATWTVNNDTFQIDDKESAEKFADAASKLIVDDLYSQMGYKGKKASVSTNYNKKSSVYVYKMDKDALKHVPPYSEVISSLH